MLVRHPAKAYAVLRSLLMFALAATAASAAELPFVNWENHPQRALALSPDGRLLAVAHTADQRVQLFDVSSGRPLPAGHVVVGIDPVAVAFRNDDELWVVNHVSDSISIVDVPARRVRQTLATDDEPFDVVFAGHRAFVSCSQVNRVLVFDAAAPGATPPRRLAILGEDPRALALSPDGRSVYVAIFESGNATTLLAGGLEDDIVALPNVVSDPRGPYGGQNPPPNAGNGFDPPIDPSSPPPAVGLIVRKDAQGRWRDDNRGDWTDFVGGALAPTSGRVPGWDLPDRDLAVIDVATLQVRYARGLMNLVMALAVNPADGTVLAVGTDARNEIRFEPRLNGRFLRVLAARVDPQTLAAERVDLNPQLEGATLPRPTAERQRALGDPRAVVFRPDGQRGWVAGLGSNNVLPIDAQGRRAGEPITVGEGPAGLALDASRDRLYVWNHFEASLSTVDLATETEIDRRAAFNPLPAAIRAGRPLLYDTHRTSGGGDVACASCHIDARMDRLAWDLGDPSAPPEPFTQNCITSIVRACEDFHAMKGPMTTQTLQDIIGHEPHHWRGDRDGIEAFNPAFEGLLGNDRQLTAAEMQAFEDFLSTLSFPPNPNRKLDNGLPEALDLEGHYTSGRFAMAGQPLGSGNAQRGFELFTRGLLDPPFQCANCHTLPTGMAVNGALFVARFTVAVGGMPMGHGPLGENRLGIVSVDGSTNVSIKVPQLRNQHEKVGFEMSQRENRAGFGFLHDGSVDSLARFFSARAFQVGSDQDVADLVAFQLAFSGSGFGEAANPLLGGPAPVSKDSHAAVGHQVQVTGATVPDALATLLQQAEAAQLELVVRTGGEGWWFDAAEVRLLPDDGGNPLAVDVLLARATAATPQVWTAVPFGLGRRLGIDRDGDGVPDRVELKQGSDPADAASTTLRPMTGPWFNPQRSGHGLDLQFVGTTLAATWYTYDDSGAPTWYLAAAPFANPWRGELLSFRWDASTGRAQSTPAGELVLSFEDARRLRFDWRLGSRNGSEPMQVLFDDPPLAAPDRSGAWFDPGEPGWGLSLYTAGDLFSAGAYFYDAHGAPRWVLGVAAAGEVVELAMESYRGACPDCAWTAPQRNEGGEVVLRFDAPRSGRAEVDVHHADGHWRRSPLPIVPLSDPPRHPARH